MHFLLNLDEFYEVRVASLLQMAEMDSTAISTDGLSIHEQFEKFPARRMNWLLNNIGY